MTTTASKLLTFEDWLTYEDGTDTRYELERGVLSEMGQAKGRHGDIMELLSNQFSRLRFLKWATLGYQRWVVKWLCEFLRLEDETPAASLMSLFYR